MYTEKRKLLHAQFRLETPAAYSRALLALRSSNTKVPTHQNLDHSPNGMLSSSSTSPRQLLLCNSVYFTLSWLQSWWILLTL
jgi:hypothetical protein